MALSFAELRKQRDQKLEKLNQELTKMTQKGGGDNRGPDDRFWKPTVDKAGNGFAIIRFLPEPPEEDMPFIRYFDHGFKGPTGLWYIENSLSSIDVPDPVSEMNRKLWTEGENSRGREIVSGTPDMPGTKRRLHYISNIYVVKDSSKPECEGKVFYFKYGAKIFDKLNQKMNPEFEGEERVNPFDLWKGCNFRLKVRKVKGYPNYDSSEFDPAAALFEDDEKLEEIWKQCRSLKEFLDPKNFKSYDELKTKLERVMDESGSTSSRRNDEAPPRQERTKPAPVSRRVAEEELPPELDEVGAGPKDAQGDKAMEWFRSLADE